MSLWARAGTAGLWKDVREVAWISAKMKVRVGADVLGAGEWISAGGEVESRARGGFLKRLQYDLYYLNHVADL